MHSKKAVLFTSVFALAMGIIVGFFLGNTQEKVEAEAPEAVVKYVPVYIERAVVREAVHRDTFNEHKDDFIRRGNDEVCGTSSIVVVPFVCDCDIVTIPPQVVTNTVEIVTETVEIPAESTTVVELFTTPEPTPAPAIEATVTPVVEATPTVEPTNTPAVETTPVVEITPEAPTVEDTECPNGRKGNGECKANNGNGNGLEDADASDSGRWCGLPSCPDEAEVTRNTEKCNDGNKKACERLVEWGLR